jgi:cell division initiation protein
MEERKLPTKFKGFDREEVESFIRLIRDEMAEISRENMKLKAEAAGLEQELKEYENLDKSLKDTLSHALRMIDDMKSDAQKDAELMVRKAKLQADEIVGKVQKTYDEIKQEIEELKKVRVHFKDEMKQLITGQLDLMDAKFSSE